MPRFRSRIFLFLLAGLCLAQSSSDLVTPAIRRVGERLACLCGSCKNTVSTCQMLGCHYSSPAKEKIAKLQAEGKSDQDIVDTFVKSEGLKSLAVPPTEGFSLLGWVMPFAAIAIGLCGIYAFMKKKRRPVVMTQAESKIDNEVLDRYHDQIEKDMAKLD